jgi:hypothetical protein
VGGCQTVNSDTAVWVQKTSKFFVSHVEESITEHVDVNGVYSKFVTGCPNLQLLVLRY